MSRISASAPLVALAAVAGAVAFFWFTFSSLPTQKAIEVEEISRTVEPARSESRSDGTGREIINITDIEWSKPTRVITGRCFVAWVDTPGLPQHMTQVSTLEKPEDWQDIDGAAEMPIAWVRHKSKGPGSTEVTQEIRRDGECR